MNAILVLGAGAFGTALSILLANHGYDVKLWVRDKSQKEQLIAARENQKYLPGIPLPQNIDIVTDLTSAMEVCHTILIALPSHAFVPFILTLKPLMTTKHRILSVTKGMSDSFFDSVVARELGPSVPYAMMSGPSFAKEVAQKLPTAVALASKDRSFLNDLHKMFHHGFFRVYLTDDILGVEIGGVVKNILAVAAGISDGLQLGANARAALICRGIAEMMRLGENLGAKKETLMGLAGCGDIVLTCTDNQSRNRRFGILLGQGLTEFEAVKSVGQTVEAVYNVTQIYQLANKHEVEMPIVSEVYRVIKENVSPKEAVTSLFARSPKDESS